ncbi:mevalonate kinase [Actinomyces slackii]|uniref:Mevalonate kinase n=1 Tax=Actinomyces slackii TaxID=52774 RepID=A0A3S4SQT7_9ACTO|nr:mevalonate kinase [Actinomyces slackii]VEG75584.1 mevalonate kinase [Actinomyces slackii]
MGSHSSPGREGRGHTWAKAILLGEHAVVYGHPAVAVPLHDLRMNATATPINGPSRLRCLDYEGPLTGSGARFDCVAQAFEAAREFAGCPRQSFIITTRSDFPHERGLGSSAAAAGAIIRAVLDACRRPACAEELFALTQRAEAVAHGRPSGLDAAATCAPGPLRFQAGEMRPVSQRIEGAHLVLADSGVHGSTRQAVTGLRERYEEQTEAVGPLIAELGALARLAVTALEDGDAPRLGTAMDRAHEVLAALGLSLPVLESLTGAARQAGALGAKLTGGGLGGCVIALADGPQPAERIGSALLHAGAAAVWTHRMHTSEAGQ